MWSSFRKAGCPNAPKKDDVVDSCKPRRPCTSGFRLTRKYPVLREELANVRCAKAIPYHPSSEYAQRDQYGDVLTDTNVFALAAT